MVTECQLCSSSLTLVSKRFGARLTHRLNRKFVRTGDTTQDSEEIATVFTVHVSKSSHNSRTNFSLQIHESKSKPLACTSFITEQL